MRTARLLLEREDLIASGPHDPESEEGFRLSTVEMLLLRVLQRPENL